MTENSWNIFDSNESTPAIDFIVQNNSCKQDNIEDDVLIILQ